MNKTELIAAVHQATELSKADVDRVLTAMTSAISESLMNGQDAVLPGLGKLKVKEKAARNGRNPKTGEAMLIPARRCVVFVPMQVLKDAIN